MTRIAPPTAAPAASATSGMAFTAATPTSVERMLPPSTGQGCANGLAGTAKTSTADAPMGATMKGTSEAASGNCMQTTTVNAMPMAAPRQASSRGSRCVPGSSGFIQTSRFMTCSALSPRCASCVRAGKRSANISMARVKLPFGGPDHRALRTVRRNADSAGPVFI